MHVLGGNRVFGTCPKRHLASIISIENVTFNAGCRLIRTGNSVGGVRHELGEGIHGGNLSAERQLTRTGNLRSKPFLSAF